MRMITLPDFLLTRPNLLGSRCPLGQSALLCDAPRSRTPTFWSVMAMTADVLSEVLSAIRLTGSVFFDVTAASPWVAEAPRSAEIVDAVRPGAQHAIEYHVITRGSCWISIVDGAPFEPVRLQEGDIAVIPHGEPHVVSSAPGMRAPPDLDSHRRPDNEGDLPYKIRTGSGGETEARLMCGFFTCDLR